MKKPAFLIVAIVWAVIALAALTILILGLTGSSLLSGLFGLSFGGDSMVWGTTNLVRQETVTAEGLESIEIKVRSHSVSITLVEGDEITIRQYDNDSENLFVIRQSGGSLSLEIEPRSIFMLFGINFNPRLEIDLPVSYAEAMSIETSSGSISVDGSPEWGDTSISSSSGTVRLSQGLTCLALDISTSSGSVNLGGAAARSISISTASGTQRLAGLQAAGAVLLNSSSGSISLDNLSGSECAIKTSSGTIRAADMQTASGISLESTSGSINTGSINAGSVWVKTSSGTLRLGDVSVPGGQAEISSTSGSHNVGSVSADAVNISSSSGTLNYSGISGSGNVSTSSGSISCDCLDVLGDMSISSNSGTQRHQLAKNQSFEISISTSSGSIRSGSIDLMYSDQSGRKAFGTVGSGENGLLEITTSSGSINIS